MQQSQLIAEAHALGISSRSSERLLMLAVLEDAVRCYQKCARRRGAARREQFDEVRGWLDSTDRSSLFSFETICDTLGLDADYVRGGLRVWHERGRRTRRPNVRQGLRTKGASG